MYINRTNVDGVNNVSKARKALFGLTSLMVLSLPLPVVANDAEPRRPLRPDINIDISKPSDRACYYQGQPYSLGAVLKVEDLWLECVPEKAFETNGRLRWQRMK